MSMSLLAAGPDQASRLTTAPALEPRFIRWFRELTIDDIPLVGGKNASLGEMIRELSGRGVRVPDGFAVTAEGYRHFMRATGLELRIRDLLHDLDIVDITALQQRGAAIRRAILTTPLPVELQSEIVAAYAEMCAGSTEPVHVAVRSSATAEDLPDASFAGQQETYLNVEGANSLIEHCRRSFASLFTDRAISYRVLKGFDHAAVALSIGVQRMVRSDLGAAGVIFTIDTETGFRDLILINASYGLGENVVLGSVTPDEFRVFKPTLTEGFRPILQRRLGTKEFKLVYDEGGGRMVRNVPVDAADRARYSLDDDDVLQLARWACVIEDHYSARHRRPTPMDIEWAKDGCTGELYILQARPETVQARKQTDVIRASRLAAPGRILVTGRSVGDKIAAGRVRIVQRVEALRDFQDGEVLVADRTDPDWEPVMKRASAIVTNRGGRTCHAAIISRELGVPAVVGAGDATSVLQNGQLVTVSCAEGDDGHVYEGKLDFEVTETAVKDLGHPRTKVMLILANPQTALAQSFLPNDGVGLARMEFIITNSIKAHPLALLNFDSITDADTRRQIEELTRGYPDKAEYFVDRLAQGIATLAAAFYPKDVILRLSDFKTNEYANLIGGRQFEPVEENPMLGFRGASRYYHPRYQAGFALECRAVQRVRREMGLTNLKVMIPFCRTVEEGLRVQEEMARHGLRRGEDGLEVYVMCEIPSNVILAEEFAEHFDGFSIGSNDLTQLILGVDRDSEIVAPIFNERNPAVLKMIAQVIETCRAKGRKIGICGQAPSDYPDFARFLVEHHIDSISLNPDSIIATTLAILQAEKSIAA